MPGAAAGKRGANRVGMPLHEVRGRTHKAGQHSASGKVPEATILQGMRTNRVNEGDGAAEG